MVFCFRKANNRTHFFIVELNIMPGIQCTLCSLWFGSELGLKIHYSKMHALVGECNWKRKVKSSNNEYLNNNMLFELCEAFGESGEEEDLMVTNVENYSEVIQDTSKSRRKRIFLGQHKINCNDQKSMFGFKCSDVQVMQNEQDELKNDENYSITNKENKEKDVDEDILMLIAPDTWSCDHHVDITGDALRQPMTTHIGQDTLPSTIHVPCSPTMTNMCHAVSAGDPVNVSTPTSISGSQQNLSAFLICN